MAFPRIFTALCLLTLLLSAPAALAKKRVALVIGNDAYGSLGKLNNAGKDARDMAERLRLLNFEVITVFNGGRRKMHRAVADFGKKLRTAEVGLAFFAGHGVQSGGKNYLIPVDAQLNDETDLEVDALDSDRILRVMRAAGNPLNIVILDACRDNPLPNRTRSATRGLAITQTDAIPNGARGTAIIYAAGPGQKAADGEPGKNGLFTGTLLKHLGRPGWNFSKSVGKTIEDVRRASGGKQVPWNLSSITGELVLKPVANATDTGTAAKTTPDKTVARQSGTDPSMAVWREIKSSNDIAAFETFLNAYPNSPMAPFAKLKIKQLGKSKQAAVSGANRYDGRWRAAFDQTCAPNMPMVIDGEIKITAGRLEGYLSYDNAVRLPITGRISGDPSNGEVIEYRGGDYIDKRKPWVDTRNQIQSSGSRFWHDWRSAHDNCRLVFQRY